MGRRLLPYLATIAVAALVTAAKGAFAPLGSEVPFLLYFGVVLFGAWYGGKWTGIFATVLSAALANYFFLGVPFRPSLSRIAALQTAVFAFEAASIILLVDVLQLSRARTTAASRRVTALQRLTTALTGAKTPREIADVAVRDGAFALEAASGCVFELDGPDSSSLVLLAGPLESEAMRPICERVQASAEEIADGRTVGTPLTVAGRSLGVLAFRFESEHALGLIERDLLSTIAEQASLALARAEGYEREVALRRRLEVLAAAAGDLSRAATRAEVSAVVVARGLAAMNADVAALYLVDEAGVGLDLADVRGERKDAFSPCSRVDAESRRAAWEAFGRADSTWIEDVTAAPRAPSVFAPPAEQGPGAFWSVPLVVEGHAVGVLALGYVKRRLFPTDKRRFAETFTQQCAQALLRALRLERETSLRIAAESAQRELELDKERDALVAEVTVRLAATLDYKASLSELAELLVPRIADWCAIDMIDEASGTFDQLAVAHVDPASVALAWELRTRYPPRLDATTGAANAMRTGKPEIYRDVSPELLARTATNEEHLRLARRLGLESALIVPLVARGVALGAITLVYAQSGRQYTQADVELAEEIARRAAISVDNARLFGAEQRARAAADEASRLKDEFLATVSHELRTPLNAILGWSQMIRSGTLDPSKHQRAQETIERNAVAMAQLIDDLLDISRIISGKMRLEVETLDLAKVAMAAVESIRPAAAAKEIALRALLDPSPEESAALPPGESRTVIGDPNRLQQIAWNLLSNAVKFTTRGGQVEVSVRRAGETVELSVTDTGAGIDRAFLPYVFDRFRQADGRITRSHGGLGLGLAITRQLVELHGGSVAVASDGLGQGSTFTVALPSAAARAAGADARSDATSKASVPAPALLGLRVLAVDDDEDARLLVRTILEKAGATVTLASNVETALAAFEREAPDVILSDLGLPEADGVELLRRIRELPPELGGRVPAAALTAYARAIDRERVLGAGFLMHLAKPVEPAELVAVVANLARDADDRRR